MTNLETPRTIRIIAAAAAAVTTLSLFQGVCLLAEPNEVQAGQTQLAQASVPATPSDTATK